MSDFEEIETTHETQWQPKMKDRLKAGADVSGSKSVLIARLDKLTTGVTSHLAEGEVTISRLKNIITSVDGRLPLKALSDMQVTVRNFEHDLETAKNELEAATRRLAEQLKQWQDFEDEYDKLSSMTNDWEARIKEFCLKNTLDEKIEQRNTFKEMVDEIASTQNAFDKLSVGADNLEKSSGELRLSMQSSQLITRFQSVLATCKVRDITSDILKDLTKKTEQHVADHQEYQEKYARCLSDMEGARARYARIVAMSSGNREDMAVKVEAIRDLISQRSGLMNLVNVCVQAGEALQSGSSPAGWEVAQTQIQKLQDVYDEIFGGLAALDRSLQSAQFLWSEYEESLRKMRLFIDYIANQLLMVSKLEVTLDKKRAAARQAHNSLSEMNDNVYQLDELQSKANSIPGRDVDSEQILQKIVADFRKLHEQFKDVAQGTDQRVVVHEKLRARIAEVSDWLNGVSQRINSCLDADGDCSMVAMQSNVETLRAVINSFDDKQAIVNSVRQSDIPAVLEGTHHDGHANIKAEVDALEKRLNDLLQGAIQDKETLEESLNRLAESEKQADMLRSWLSSLETELRTIGLADTLANKEKTLANVTRLGVQIIEKEPEILQVLEDVLKFLGGQGDRKMSRLSDFDSRFQQIKSFAK
ncbi:hypothetical protein BIW11_05466, partial [Tropilaelaps mercedesae]